jgi:uncharacterized protein with ParB-like and HNH nuclease domain
MSLSKGETIIEDRLGEENVVTPFKYSITSYGADYPVDGLVKRMQNGDILIPSFQRGYVWTWKQASRFIESLLLGLPAPGIFLSKEDESSQLLVIDGRQRLQSLQWFYEGIFRKTGHDFTLRGVQSEFNGLTYQTLKSHDRRRLDDSILHATIVRQDVPSQDKSSIYYIFERLNTGGTRLLPQEIRACIYHGKLNDLLRELNKTTTSWRSIFGNPHSRMRDQELILRFIALRFCLSDYKRPMDDFLNKYMGWNKDLTHQNLGQLQETFTKTIDVIFESIGKRAFRPKAAFNAAVFDSVMVGISRRLEKGDLNDHSELRKRYESLLNDPTFIISTEESTSNEDRVKDRVLKATEIFADVP